MALHFITPYFPLSLSIWEKDDDTSGPGSQVGTSSPVYSDIKAVVWCDPSTMTRHHGSQRVEQGDVSSTRVSCYISRFLGAHLKLLHTHSLTLPLGCLSFLINAWELLTKWYLRFHWYFTTNLHQSMNERLGILEEWFTLAGHTLLLQKKNPITNSNLL